MAGPWRLGHLPHWISIATEFPPHDPVPMEGGEGRERERERGLLAKDRHAQRGQPFWPEAGSPAQTDLPEVSGA